MKNKFLYIALSSLLFTFGSCKLEEANIDTTRQNDVDIALILPAAQAQTARNIGSMGGRVSSTIVQHVTGIDAQPEGYTNYIIDETTLDGYWRSGLYVGAMRDSKDIISKAEENNFPHYKGIAQILLAQNLGMATSLWGDVPYSEGFQGADLLQTKFDSQESIYTTILDLLEESIVLLNGSDEGRAVGNEDLIFKGDIQKWILTAKTLKLRYVLHHSKKENVAAQLESIVNEGVLTSNAMQPNFYFDNSINGSHPIAAFGINRPGQLAVSDYFVDLLTNRNDPRLAKITKEVSGMNVVYDANSTNLFWSQLGTAQPYISYSEVSFIKAEMALMKNDYVKANEYIQDGIRSSMSFMLIPETAIATYLANLTPVSSTQTASENLELMMEEKYIALYGQNSIEAWNDFRRTGFPVLTPPSNASASFNPSRVVPRRLVYPLSEKTTNKANVDAAISAQGGDLMDVNTWIFK